MLKRSLGVKGAVFALYGIGIVFCVLGVMISKFQARFIYALVLLVAFYIGVYAIKIARRSALEAHVTASEEKKAAKADS